MDPADPSPSRSREGLGEGLSPNGAAPDTPSPDPSREREGSERSVLQDNAPPGRIVFSEKFACPVSGFPIAEIEPRLFSFNAPQGACPDCDGLGEKLLFDSKPVVPNKNPSITPAAVTHGAQYQPPSPF